KHLGRHDDVAYRGGRQGLRLAQVTGPLSGLTPRTQELPGCGEALHAGVAVVRDEYGPVGTDRHTRRAVKLSVARTRATEGVQVRAGGVEAVHLIVRRVRGVGRAVGGDRDA